MSTRIFKKIDVGVNALLRFVFDDVEARIEKGRLVFPLKFEMVAPQIGHKQLLEVESFFREVWREYSGEAIVFLYFSPVDGGRWRFVAIPQKVSGAHLDWITPGAAPNGWYLAGSFHSHNVMSAFHSGTDNADELGWDGIHVTIGKIVSPHPEYAASVVIDGVRFEVEISDLVEPADEVVFPAAWMEQVTRFIPPVLSAFEYPFNQRFSSRLDEGGDDD